VIFSKFHGQFSCSADGFRRMQNAGPAHTVRSRRHLHRAALPDPEGELATICGPRKCLVATHSLRGPTANGGIAMHDQPRLVIAASL
jgi:hypothetical protein